MNPHDAGSYVKTEGERVFTGEARLELFRTLVEKNKGFRFTARGFSMLPFLQNGDILTIEPVRGMPPVPGDLVAAVFPDIQQLIVHRVIRKSDTSFVLKGDNRAGPDGVFSQSDILGRVIRVEREGRAVSFGLGPERVFIAWMSRRGLLRNLVRVMNLAVRPISGIRKNYRNPLQVSGNNSAHRVEMPADPHEPAR